VQVCDWVPDWRETAARRPGEWFPLINLCFRRMEQGTGSPRRRCREMENRFLALIASSLIVLVTAFALATPRLDGYGQPEKTLLTSALRK